MVEMNRSKTNPEEQNRSLLDWRQTIGLEPVKTALASVMNGERMHPVVLLHGVDGVGKRHLAMWMAAYYVCKTKNACGICGSCREVLAGIHPDVIVIDPDENHIKTAVLETLKSELDTLSPDGLRVGVIMDCDRMTREAANRMLKTLEEPPAHIRLILTTSRTRALLPTVLGRCLRWSVPVPAPEVVTEWLKGVLKQHGRPVESKELLQAWVRRAGGAPGRLVRQIEDQDDREAAILDRVSQLISATSPRQAQHQAEELVRSTRATVPEILAASEWALNHQYQKETQEGIDGSGVKARWSRRQILSKLRRLAVRGSVTLNAQLAAEAIGLAGFGEVEWQI